MSDWLYASGLIPALGLHRISRQYAEKSFRESSAYLPRRAAYMHEAHYFCVVRDSAVSSSVIHKRYSNSICASTASGGILHAKSNASTL
jgi:hypothetical protein